MVKTHKYPEGTEVIQQGSIGKDMFIILKGEVDVFNNGRFLVRLG
jgi:CRP-like cAMP-binding protein